MGFTLKDIELLKQKGLIRGFADNKSVSIKKPDDNSIAKKKADKIKGWIELQLQVFCDANRLELKKEFQFDPDRKWRIDYAIPSKKIAFEYEGLSSRKNGHTTKTGYTGNTDKYNELAAQGWKLFRYTYLNYKQLNNDLTRLV